MNWINYFLSNKQQCVVNGYNSEESAIVSGVPQGTVLGPILFLVHINNKIMLHQKLDYLQMTVCYREMMHDANSVVYHIFLLF